MAAKGAMMSNLGKLFTRPKSQYEDHTGETITINPTLYDLVYIRSCSGCVFTVATKCAKCIMESCKDTQIIFEEPVMSGTLELIKCEGVIVTIQPKDSLPSVSVDRCSNVHLHLQSPKGVGFIHTMKSSEVYVHMQSPYTKEQKLDIPEADSEGWSDEYLSRCSVGKMFTVNGIRVGGGYLSTEKEEEEAQKRVKELERRLGEYLDRIITIHPKGTKVPTAGALLAAGPTTTESSSGSKDKKETAEEKQEEKQEKQTAEEGKEKENGVFCPLAAAFRRQKEGLKPTETVETHLPTVGMGSGGGKGRGLTNIKDDAEKREYFDSSKELQRKVEQVAQWVKDSKHAIVFTGAGISTSAGIPDFRSGMKTVLPTGPGVWELQAQGAVCDSKHVVPILKALPTPTHMAVVKLHETGKIKFTVSQNVDGLHRRSGLGPACLSELHGNTNLETCRTCGRQYLRDFETREAPGVFDHMTSRKCDNPDCRGALHDSIINFGETLPVEELKKAFEHANKADLCIVLGSSLRVRPACQVPEVVYENGGRVVVCNLQQIPQFPADKRSLPVFCLCDDFMLRLMTELNLEVPNFRLKRRIKVTTAAHSTGGVQVIVTGVDTEEDIPYSFLKSVSLQYGDVLMTAPTDPFIFSLPANVHSATLTLSFHGHYREPSYSVGVNLDHNPSYLNLQYDITTNQWDSTTN